MSSQKQIRVSLPTFGDARDIKNERFELKVGRTYLVSWEHKGATGSFLGTYFDVRGAFGVVYAHFIERFPGRDTSVHRGCPLDTIVSARVVTTGAWQSKHITTSRIGPPYAWSEPLNGKPGVTCPVCGEHFVMKRRNSKDERLQYAEHFAAKAARGE